MYPLHLIYVCLPYLTVNSVRFTRKHCSWTGHVKLTIFNYRVVFCLWQFNKKIDTLYLHPKCTSKEMLRTNRHSHHYSKGTRHLQCPADNNRFDLQLAHKYKPTESFRISLNPGVEIYTMSYNILMKYINTIVPDTY